LGFGWVTSHTFRRTAATLLNDGGDRAGGGRSTRPQAHQHPAEQILCPFIGKPQGAAKVLGMIDDETAS
jgi:hypothetical protein